MKEEDYRKHMGLMSKSLSKQRIMLLAEDNIEDLYESAMIPRFVVGALVVLANIYTAIDPIVLFDLWSVLISGMVLLYSVLSIYNLSKKKKALVSFLDMELSNMLFSGKSNTATGNPNTVYVSQAELFVVLVREETQGNAKECEDLRKFCSEVVKENVAKGQYVNEVEVTKEFADKYGLRLV